MNTSSSHSALSLIRFHLLRFEPIKIDFRSNKKERNMSVWNFPMAKEAKEIADEREKEKNNKATCWITVWSYIIRIYAISVLNNDMKIGERECA